MLQKIIVAGPEACCKDVVKIAQSEVENNRQATKAMREFASVREADAEVGCHKVLVRHGHAADIPITWTCLGETKEMKQFPWIKLSAWAQYLLDLDLVPKQLVVVSSWKKMTGVLQEFWSRFRGLDPNHPVFTLAQNGILSLDRLVPYYTHSDEGRTFRDGALWVLNTHGVIGRGTASYLKSGRHRAPLAENAQGLNYVGNTWGTHCLIATMLKCVATPEAISKFMSDFAADAHFLLHTGVSAGDGSGRHIWMVHFATKGDLPALAKLAKFTRTFGHAPKAASSRKPCEGVCWRCLAGQERNDELDRVALPYEDVSLHPVWAPTIGKNLPWLEAPSILEGLGLDAERSIDFFQSDFFHNVHLGMLKAFTASALVTLVESNPPLPCMAHCSSVDAKFEVLTDLYKGYFRSRNRRPYVSELSRDTCCWPQPSACPAAKWNKGQATTEIMAFLDWFGQTHLTHTHCRKLKSIVARLVCNPTSAFLH